MVDGKGLQFCRLANFPHLKCDVGESLYNSLHYFVLGFNKLYAWLMGNEGNEF